MKLYCHRIDKLPLMSWCAKISRNKNRVDVFHGPWVLTSSSYFVEGIWDAPLDEPVFDKSSVFMGSGGKVMGDQIVFVSPSHNLESLVWIQNGLTLFVSNSLVFLLVESGLSLDPNYPFYQTDMWTSMNGLNRYVRTLPTREGPRIHIGFYVNLKVGSKTKVVEYAKPDINPLENFETYNNYLSTKVAALTRNATDRRRTQPFEPLTTISSGYDSPAASVLAMESGCRDAVTFETGIEYTTTRLQADDSGANIARQLGMSVTLYRPSEIKNLHSNTFAEFAACGDSFDLQFSMFEDQLRGKLLFTGHPGGFWKRSFSPCTTLVRTDPAGSGLAEFRLRVGFVHLPVVTIGAKAHPSIHAISNSKSMQQWSIGGDYDRPIPRRIVEEAGISRSWFGQSKKGSFTALILQHHLPKKLPEFREYMQEHLQIHTLTAQLRLKIRREKIIQLNKVGRVASQYFGLQAKQDRYFEIPQSRSAEMIVPWGVQMTRKRYERNFLI